MIDWGRAGDDDFDDEDYDDEGELDVEWYPLPDLISEEE